jgi:hypothetical protein
MLVKNLLFLLMFELELVFVIAACDVGVVALTGSKGVSEDDKMLLDCLERVSYAKVFL